MRSTVGAATPPHRHDCDEVVLCQAGHGELHLDGEVKVVVDGEGTEHRAHAVVLAMGSGYRELGLPDEIVWRQPFPGPGLGIRIVGEITQERLDLLREADAIVRHELTAAGLDDQIWQCPVVLLADVRSVGVMGDGRTYGHPIVLRPVSSEDAMTADWTRLPYDLLAKISNRITNEVAGVNRVVLDVTSKPPGTIEWE